MKIEGWLIFARLPGQPEPFDKVSSNRAMLEHLDWFPNGLQEFENATHKHPDYAAEIELEPAPSPEAEPDQVEPSTPVIVVQPTPETIETAAPVIPQSSALTQTSPPPAIFITVTKPTKIAIGRRDEIIPAGTKVQLVARASDTVQVRYKGESTLIKISSTDLK